MTLLLYNGQVNQAVNLSDREDLFRTPFLYHIKTIIPLNPNFRNKVNLRPGKIHTSGLNGQNKYVTCIGIDYLDLTLGAFGIKYAGIWILQRFSVTSHIITGKIGFFSSCNF